MAEVSAKPNFRSTRAHRRSRRGRRAVLSAGLALAMTRDGKAAEAEPMLRESLKLAKANHLEGTASPENVSAALGECLLAGGEPVDRINEQDRDIRA